MNELKLIRRGHMHYYLRKGTPVPMSTLELLSLSYLAINLHLGVIVKNKLLEA